MPSALPFLALWLVHVHLKVAFIAKNAQRIPWVGDVAYAMRRRQLHTAVEEAKERQLGWRPGIGRYRLQQAVFVGSGGQAGGMTADDRKEVVWRLETREVITA